MGAVYAVCCSSSSDDRPALLSASTSASYSGEEQGPLVSPYEQAAQAYEKKENRGWCSSRGCCCCLGSICCCFGILWVTVFIVGYFVLAPKLVDLDVPQIRGAESSCDPAVSPQAIGQAKNLTQQLWFPGCQSGNLVSSMETLQAALTDNLVSFKSRNMEGHEQVDLSAWWLPADPARVPLGMTAPRVVVQHGTSSDANKYRPMVAAYMLRSMGFSVLVVNLRDHCTSGSSSYETIGWGFDYPLDTLGAWDYAVQDPDGILGGNVSNNQVALWGCSMGAFLSATAFGMEAHIPGAFLDSFVWGPFPASEWGLQHMFGDFLSAFLLPGTWAPAWLAVLLRAQVDLTLNTPEKTLPKGPPSGRKIGMSENKRDKTTPFADALSLQDFIKKSSKQYSLVANLVVDTDCNGTDHVIAHLTSPNEYRSSLCDWASATFNRDPSLCALSELPSLQ